MNWKNIKIPDKGKGKKTFFDDVMKESSKRLAPNKYSKQIDWKLSQNSGLTHGHLLKGKFNPGNRETSAGEIMRKEKARKSPDPGAYDLPVPKIHGSAKSTSD